MSVPKKNSSAENAHDNYIEENVSIVKQWTESEKET